MLFGFYPFSNKVNKSGLELSSLNPKVLCRFSLLTSPFIKKYITKKEMNVLP